MSPLSEILENVKQEESIKEKTQLAEMILMAYARAKKKPTAEDLDVLEQTVFSEMEKLVNAIPKTESYRKKCDLFTYQNALMGLFSMLAESHRDIGASDMGVAKTLVHMVAEEQWVEEAVDEMYGKDKITAADATALIEKVRTATDEFRRGMLWQGTMHFIDKTDKMDEAAKGVMRAFICEELLRYLDKGADMTDEESANAEFIADVCQKFMNDDVKEILVRMLALPQSNVRFYVVATLLTRNVEVDAEAIRALAAEPTYADMTHRMLRDMKKLSLFPPEYDTPEYLAKSNLLHWLLYPTELGCAPDEIESVGSVKAKGDRYYVFKFRSNSDTLSEECKNKWLFGWASGTGGMAFSNFDLYESVQGDTPEKTLKAVLKAIKKA